MAAFADAEEIIASTAPDAVDIAAQVGAHPAICRLAADHGVAILCQKPLAATAGGAARLVEEIDTRVRFMVHENWRLRPTYRQVKTWFDDGAIGRPGFVELRVLSSGLIAADGGNYPALRRQPFLTSLPRLLIFEALVHHLNLLSWLLGDIVVVAARISRICHAVRCEDSASIMRQTNGCIPVALNGCLAAPGAATGIEDHLTIYGDVGAIVVEGSTASLDGTRTDSKSWDFDRLYADSFKGALGEFATAIREGRAFETEARENLTVLRLVESAYEKSTVSR